MNTNRCACMGWISMASTIGLLVTNLVLDHGSNTVVRFIGVGFLLSSPVFFIPPFIVLAREGKPDKGRTYMETSRVVRQGLYRIVRHPQYLGYIFLNVGFMLLAQSWAATVFAAISISIFIALAAEEEKQLKLRFSGDYAEYCQEIPRFNFVVGLIRYMRSSNN